MSTIGLRRLWLDRFSRLKVDVDAEKGRAPHKPLLILSVLDMLEGGQLLSGDVVLSPDLVLRFLSYWPIVEPRRRNKGDIRMPFHALGTDRVWSVFDSDGRPSRARATSTLARVDVDLWGLLCTPVFRMELRRLLVSEYFPSDEQIALSEALGIKPTGRYSSAPPGEPATYNVALQAGRDARFKVAVVSAYHFTCVLTGHRLTTIDQATLVEAAHIRSFISSRNNDPDNGLALTPTAHALFDLGLWSVSDDLRIIVKRDAFVESGPLDMFLLKPLHGRQLQFGERTVLRPNPLHLAWHRECHGFK